MYKIRRSTKKRSRKPANVKIVKRSQKKSRSIRRSRKRRSMSRSMNKPVVKMHYGGNTISEPLIVYGSEGCDACEDMKDFLNKNNIKYKYYIRKDYDEKVSRLSNNYKYVPAVFNSKHVFLGGRPEVKKLLNVA